MCACVHTVLLSFTIFARLVIYVGCTLWFSTAKRFFFFSTLRVYPSCLWVDLSLSSLSSIFFFLMHSMYMWILWHYPPCLRAYLSYLPCPWFFLFFFHAINVHIDPLRLSPCLRRLYVQLTTPRSGEVLLSHFVFHFIPYFNLMLIFFHSISHFSPCSSVRFHSVKGVPQN